MKYLSVFAMIILSACATSHSSQTDTVEVESTPLVLPSPKISLVAEDNTIREIDFQNFTYDWYPADMDVPVTGRKIILKGGSMDTGFDYGKEPRKFFLIDDGVKYGDLTGDGIEEAVVVLGMITSGTARAGIIFVYGESQGGPKRIWVYETGDRWDYGYHNAKVEDGLLQIERYKPKIVEYQGQEHNMSQSDMYIRDYYKWNGIRFDNVKTYEVPTDPNDSSPWVLRGK